jgi:type IV secretion system protein VirB4
MPVYKQQMQRERAVSDHIPYSSHITDNTILTLEGDLMRIWRVDGIAFETADGDEILLRKEQFNTLLRSIGSSNNIALWSHMIRRHTTDKLHGAFENDFCRELDKKYYKSFDSYQMMANELYLTAIYRPTPSKINKLFAKSARRSTEEIKKDHRAAIKKLDEIAYQIEAGMQRYGADSKGLEVLGTYKEKDEETLYSSALEFLNYLISGEWQKVRVPKGPLNTYLGNSWIHAGNEIIEIRSPTKIRYAQAIDFKDYSAHTEPGLLNGLMYQDYELVITQSYSFMPKMNGKEFLERQENQLLNTEDGSVSQIEEIRLAQDQLIQGQFTMGEYHFSLMVFGDSIDDVRNNTTKAMTTIQDRGFLAALATTATDAVYYAQLPCNWKSRPRIAGITSKNFAGLSPFHNFRAGKRSGNPWGDAVMLFKTPSGQPLYFNLHYTKGDENAFDKKVLGNTRIIGQSGSGKTVLLNMLLCQLQKFAPHAPNGFGTIFFDKDRGAEAAIRAIGGKYLAIKNGMPTGINPFQMEPTESNVLFLEKLVRKLAQTHKQITTTEELKISHGVRTVMKMPKHLRRLSTVLQNITEGDTEEERKDSLAKRLSKWCYDDGTSKEGALAWVLDNQEDQIDLSTHTNYGIDGTDFLDNEDVCIPISMYLLHRMNEMIDGRRFVYFMDEAWKWVGDDSEAFQEFAGNKQLTIRKQDGLGIFSTQMPSSLLKSKIASHLVQQVATEVYLPNPKADYHEYTEGFKLTDAEFDVVKSFGEESRMFLVKQGSQSMIGVLNLAGFEEELNILSGSTDNVEILDDVIREHGEEPNDWMPHYQAKIKERQESMNKRRVQNV